VIESADTSSPSMQRSRSMQQKVVRRTEPYGPPYNFPMPGKYVNLRGPVGPSRTPDPVSVVDRKPIPVVEKKRSRKFRRFRTKRSFMALARKYPQDDLVHALDQKLSALKQAQKVDDNFPPRYIWGSESDASLVPLGKPDVSRTQTGWRASVKRRVVSESRLLKM